MGEKAEENFRPVCEMVTRTGSGMHQLRKVASASEAVEEGKTAAWLNGDYGGDPAAAEEEGAVNAYRPSVCTDKCRSAAWQSKRKDGLALVEEQLTRALTGVRTLRHPRLAG